MQFLAIVNRFIVKTFLNSAFTNDIKRKDFFFKNVHSCRLSLFKHSFVSMPGSSFFGYLLSNAFEQLE